MSSTADVTLGMARVLFGRKLVSQAQQGRHRLATLREKKPTWTSYYGVCACGMRSDSMPRLSDVGDWHADHLTWALKEDLSPATAYGGLE
jgi:hypothetical protein